jgi:hypothetical protein
MQTPQFDSIMIIIFDSDASHIMHIGYQLEIQDEKQKDAKRQVFHAHVRIYISKNPPSLSPSAAC